MQEASLSAKQKKGSKALPEKCRKLESLSKFHWEKKIDHKTEEKKNSKHSEI